MLSLLVILLFNRVLIISWPLKVASASFSFPRDGHSTKYVQVPAWDYSTSGIECSPPSNP